MRNTYKRTGRAALIAVMLLTACGPALSAQQKENKNPSEIGETVIGDVVADAMRAALGTDAALINAGSLGIGPLPGKINEETVEQLVPYTSDIVVAVKLTGGDIQLALERSVSTLPRRNSGFLQVSGITFICDTSKKTGLRVSNLKIAGEPVDPDAVYTVALTDFLSSGGSGYSSLKNGKLIEDSETALGDIVLRRADISEDAVNNTGTRIRITAEE